MPLRSATQLRMRGEVVELVSELVDHAQDTPESLAAAARARVVEHQIEAMTDDAILDPPGLDVASVLESRDVLPDPLRAALASVGLEPLSSESGGAEDGAFAGLFAAKKRGRLDRHGARFVRLAHVSSKLGALEDALTDAPWRAPLVDGAEALAEALREAAIAHLGLDPRRDLVEALEGVLLRARAERPGRWVVHPALVRAIGAELGERLRDEAPDTAWAEDDDEAPLHVAVEGGLVVRTDPAYRVVDLVVRGRAASLSEYLARVVRQSRGEVD
jgi:hypothetical protein